MGLWPRTRTLKKSKKSMNQTQRVTPSILMDHTPPTPKPYKQLEIKRVDEIFYFLCFLSQSTIRGQN